MSYLNQVVTKTKTFTGIPLQCQMLAEAFDEELKIFYQSVDLGTVCRCAIICLGQCSQRKTLM